MRKFTSLMLMLLCAVTTWAGPTDLPKISTVENPIYYTIVNTRSSQPGGLMYFAGDNVGLKDEQAVVIEEKHMFYFTGSHEALYVHNAATDLKLATIGDGNKAAGSWTKEGSVWAVGVSPMGGGLAFGPQGGLNGNSCWNECNYATAADKPDFTTWSASDAGSVFLVDLVANYDNISIDAFYTIECPLFEQVQGVKKGLLVNEDGSLGWNTINLKNKNHYWVPTKVEGNTVALKNLGTGQFLNGTGLSGETADATVKHLGLGQYNIISNGNTLHANNHGNGAGSGSNIVSWGGSVGSASAWAFYEQEDPTTVIDVVYNFTYGGETKYTQTKAAFVGKEYPAIETQFPYGLTATKPTGTIAAEEVKDGVVTKNIELTVELPFVAAATTDAITTWYYVQMHSNPSYTKYIQYVAGQAGIEWADAEMTAGQADSYSWAFVGDIFNGFKLVNKAAGLEKAVNNDASLDDIANATNWTLNSSKTVADAFCLKRADGQHLNAQGSKVAFWGDNDAGSTFIITERPSENAALQALIATAEAHYAFKGTAVGYYTEASAEALLAAINTAKGIQVATEDDVTALQKAIDALAINLPATNKFYYIASAMPETDGRSGQKMYVNADGGMQFQNAETLANAFQFIEAGDNTFYLYNVCTGLYLSTNKGHGGGQAETKAATTEGAVKVAISNMGRENVVKIVPVGGAMLHAQANGSSVVGWNNENNTEASAWIISEVADITALSHSVTVSAAGYSTLCVGYNAAIPAEVKCYVVSSTTNGWAHLEPITGVLPANTPVILENAGEFEFTYSTETPATIETNLLEGSTITKKITDQSNTYYILSIVDNIVGLYPDAMSEIVEGEGENAVSTKTFVNNAFKAYLPIAATQGALSYGFDFGGTTAIEGIEAVAGEQAIYDLTGRKIDAITAPGLYIINGVKTIVE